LGLRLGSQGARSRGQQRDPEEGKNRVACGGGYPRGKKGDVVGEDFFQ